MDSILRRMKRKEKIALCTGADLWHSRGLPRLGVRRMSVADGPHGLRFQPKGSAAAGIHTAQPAVCFPTASLMGCSWDPDLVRAVGEAVGRQARAVGVDAVLAPGINLQRSALCGRFFEYYSEDPLLAGRLGAAAVEGIQSTGTGSCVKHFACNSQEYKRFSGDSRVDERTLRELYLRGFEEAVRRSKPSMVMCAYNKINGVYCSENRWLLTDVLRNEWGFDGVVVTDWGAMRDQRKGFAAGCDWSMPSAPRRKQKEWKKALAHGILREEDIHRSAHRMLSMLRRFDAADLMPADTQEQHRLALRAARESAVLLKNEGAVLPLAEGTSVALIGRMAKEPRIQGSGSSHVTPTQVETLAEHLPHIAYAEGYDADGNAGEEQIREAVRLAQSAEVAVVAVGLTDAAESEGFDRTDLHLPGGQDRLVEAVAKVNPRTVVVLAGGAPMLLPWLEQTAAVLYIALSGQAGGKAAAQLLLGEASPAGRLAALWPADESSIPGYSPKPDRINRYTEGVFMGYRGTETHGTPVQFPFGFGLSYTSFAYSDLQWEGDTVSLAVQNTGERAAAETVQLYIEPPQGETPRPVRELRGFQKIFLLPGEKKQVRFTLSQRDLALWDNGWCVPGGIYTAAAGASVQDIRCRASRKVAPARLEGSHMPMPEPLPLKAPPGYTLENSLHEMQSTSRLARIICRGMRWGLHKTNGTKSDSDAAFRMMYASSADSALFSLVNDSCGFLPLKVARGMVLFANGHRLRGIWHMCFGREKEFG